MGWGGSPAGTAPPRPQSLGAEGEPVLGPKPGGEACSGLPEMVSPNSPVQPAAHTLHIITPYQLCRALSSTCRPRDGVACPPPAQQMGWAPSPKLGPSVCSAPRD